MDGEEMPGKALEKRWCLNIGLHTGARANVVLLTDLLTSLPGRGEKEVIFRWMLEFQLSYAIEIELNDLNSEGK